MNKNKSFTLIELLVVIVIIGILAGVIMISTSSSIDKASIAKLKVFEESVANDLAGNMVSRWKLDGDADDDWGNSNGTIYGATAKSEGDCISGTCLYFNGTTDYVDYGGNSDLGIKKNFHLSFSFWMNADSSRADSTTQTLLEKNDPVGTYGYDG